MKKAVGKLVWNGQLSSKFGQAQVSSHGVCILRNLIFLCGNLLDLVRMDKYDFNFKGAPFFLENLVFKEVNRICSIQRVDVVAAKGVCLAGVVQIESHAVCFLDF